MEAQVWLNLQQIWDLYHAMHSPDAATIRKSLPGGQDFTYFLSTTNFLDLKFYFVRKIETLHGLLSSNLLFDPSYFTEMEV